MLFALRALPDAGKNWLLKHAFHGDCRGSQHHCRREETLESENVRRITFRFHEDQERKMLNSALKPGNFSQYRALTERSAEKTGITKPTLLRRLRWSIRQFPLLH